jgi:flavin reductase (DIM6/NTAB) family NADH-FMN oxidoreductase RutF
MAEGAALQDLFRQAWGRFPTGVAIVSSLEEDGRPHGMTANSLTSVSLEPPLVVVSVGHGRHTHRYIRQRGRYGINFLAEEQAEAALYYARDPRERTPPPPVAWAFAPSGTPKVVGAMAFMDCRVVGTWEAGDHTLFLGQVEAIEVSPDRRPLLYCQRRFYALPPTPLR